MKKTTDLEKAAKAFAPPVRLALQLIPRVVQSTLTRVKILTETHFKLEEYR